MFSKVLVTLAIASSAFATVFVCSDFPCTRQKKILSKRNLQFLGDRPSRFHHLLWWQTSCCYVARWRFYPFSQGFRSCPDLHLCRQCSTTGTSHPSQFPKSPHNGCRLACKLLTAVLMSPLSTPLTSLLMRLSDPTATNSQFNILLLVVFFLNFLFSFIRFESVSLKDAAQPQFPALAFSAKFT